MGRCPSGQWEQTVNLPADAYGGSNPSRPTSQTKSGFSAEPVQRLVKVVEQVVDRLDADGKPDQRRVDGERGSPPPKRASCGGGAR